MSSPTTSTRSSLSYVILSLVIAALLASPVSGARQWAKVQNGTLVSAEGELLRGIFFDPDWTPTAMPSQAQVQLMREYGFNTLHVYGEHPCPSDGLVGGTVRPTQIDTLVDYTRDNDLYMVLTIGQLCPDDDGALPLPGLPFPEHYITTTYDRQFAIDFWTKYANLYKNETHVIFELINEPWWIMHSGTVHSQGYPSNVLDDQADVYELVRSKAANTPILVFSYGGLNNVKAPEQSCCATVQDDWNALNSRLPANMKLRPTTKDAVAFHTYGSGTINAIRTVTQTVRGQGIAIINTEVQRDDSPPLSLSAAIAACGSQAAIPCVREEQHEVYEQEEISWLSFMKARQNLANNTDWDLRVRDQFQGAGGAPPALIWIPDDPQADWPVERAPASWCGQALHLEFVSNGKFVQRGGDGYLYANASGMSNATRFLVECQPSGKVRLKNMSSGKYVDPGWTSSSTALVATSATAGTAQEFDLLLRRDGTLILRSPFSSGHPRWRIVTGNTSSTKLFDNQTMWVNNARFNWYLTGTSTCGSGTETLCLTNGRFEVKLKYFNGGASGQGVTFPHPTADTTGYFWFFDSLNLEVGVKVLDGSAINGNYWVYHGAITTLPYTLTIRDTQKNVIKSYQKTSSDPCGGSDIGAFAKSMSGSTGHDVAGFMDPYLSDDSATPVVKATCTPGPNHSCLLGDRFKVEVKQNGVAKPAIELNDLTGTVWFYSADNPEVFVKVLDGRAINNHFWVYYGSMTDQSYTVTVTDTVTSTSKTYNPPAPLCGDADTLAF